MTNIFLKGKKYFLATWLTVFVLTCMLQQAVYADAKKNAELTLKLQNQLPELTRLAKAQQNHAKKKSLTKIVKQAKKVIKKAAKNPGRQNLKSIKKALEALQAVKKTSLVKNTSGCDVCSELSELDSEVSDCCKAIKQQLNELLELITDDSPCNEARIIDHVPIVIAESGKYCVTEDLAYAGAEGTAAITVTANNVTINFANHSLTLSGNVQGIYVHDVSEFTLENDRIQSTLPTTSPSSVAIHLENVSKAHLDNVYTMNTTRGIQIVASTDVLIEHSLVQNHNGLLSPTPTNFGAGIWVESSSGVTVDNTGFIGRDSEALSSDDSTIGLYIFGDSSKITLKNSSLNRLLTSILAHRVTGLIIEDCHAIALPSSFTSEQFLVQLGALSVDSLANDVIIRNSTFENELGDGQFVGLRFFQGTGCILENLIVTVGGEGNYPPIGVHIGPVTTTQENFSYTNIYARDCIFKGNSFFSLFITSGQDITFSHCQFTGSQESIIKIESFVIGNPTSRCQIVDSVITGSNGLGIDINGESHANSVVNCEVSNSLSAGIVVNNSPTNTHIRGNRVFGNGLGIINVPVSSEIYFNTSCNNQVLDCIGVNPSQQPSDPAVAGSNICCQLGV